MLETIFHILDRCHVGLESDHSPILDVIRNLKNVAPGRLTSESTGFIWRYDGMMRIEILTSAKALYEQIARTAKKSFIEIDTCLSIACGGLVHGSIIGIADSRYEAHILHPTTPRYKVLIVSDNMSADDLFTVVDFPDDPDLSKDGRRHLTTHALRLMSISYDDLFVP